MSAIMMKYISQFTRTGKSGEAGGMKGESWSNTDDEPKRIRFDAEVDKATAAIVKTDRSGQPH